MEVAQFEHAGVGGGHADLREQILACDAGLIDVDDESRDSTSCAAAQGGSLARIRKYDDRMRDAGVGDQILDAIKSEMVRFLFVRRRHLQRIAAGVGLGQAEREDLVADA